MDSQNCFCKITKISQNSIELTVTCNGIILKGDQIVLPETLQDLAVQLAHRGNHPGQSGIVRRLRSHFFFHDMDAKVNTLTSTCLFCNMHSDKKTSETLLHHRVPDKCWDTVAVDLFGPMPSKNHVVVVQDLSSKFPAAKLVKNTSAKQVLPVLSEIYNTYGNPAKQISDNGSPFNSAAMQEFSDRRGIDLQKIPPLHPSSNPAETFMRPPGKTMKIAHSTNTNENDSLQTLLSNYRNTPHPATGIAPAAMLFRDGPRSILPRVTATDEEVQDARKRDLHLKQQQQQKVNSGKFKIDSHFNVGDHVLIRNYHKQRKFDPVFLPDDYVIVEIRDNGRCLTVEKVSDGARLKRHPDDVKKFEGTPVIASTPQYGSELDILKHYIAKFTKLTNELGETSEPFQFQQQQQHQQQQQQLQQQQMLNTETIVPTLNNSTRITRSAGNSFSWSKEMNADDILLPAQYDDEAVNPL